METTYITAKNSEEFKMIEDFLKNLPEKIQSQIENASYGLIGFTFEIKVDIIYGDYIHLPNNTKQICFNNDGIYVHCEKCTFKIIGDIQKLKKNIMFIECNL